MLRRKLGVCFLLALSLTGLARAQYSEEEEEVDESDVLVLSEANFDEALTANKHLLVEFYAPWCHHCKLLKPHYAEAATVLNQTSSGVTLAKVDATEEKALAERFEIKGFPTLLWFAGGKSIEYTGGRDAEGILRWVGKRTGPPAASVSTAQEYKAAVTNKPLVLLAFFSSFEGKEYSAFKEVAQASDDLDFLQTSSPDVAGLAGLTKAPGFAIRTRFPGFEAKHVASPGHAAFKDAGGNLSAALQGFILAEKLPPWIEFSAETQQQIFGAGIDLQVKGRVVFVTSPLEAESSSMVAGFFGADAASTNVQVYGLMKMQKRYKLHEPVTEKALLAFIAGVASGNLTPEYRSQPVPDYPKEGDVAVVVGKSFDDVVQDPDKDVFLEVYSPNCGHCKALAPTWKKLAKQLRKVPSITIAKMDGQANEHADLGDIAGFPHLVLFPAHNSEPVTYEGDRSIKSLRDFLKMNAAIPYQVPKRGKKEDSAGVHVEL